MCSLMQAVLTTSEKFLSNHEASHWLTVNRLVLLSQHLALFKGIRDNLSLFTNKASYFVTCFGELSLVAVKEFRIFKQGFDRLVFFPFPISFVVHIKLLLNIFQFFHLLEILLPRL